MILQLAESVSFLRQVDLFKVRGKFALSDAYEDHFALPKGKYLLVTHRRIILLQVSLQSKNIVVYLLVLPEGPAVKRGLFVIFSNHPALLGKRSLTQPEIRVLWCGMYCGII